MAKAPDAPGGGDGGPADLLPEDSILEFEEYMAMQRAVGHGTRFAILHALIDDGPMSATDLGDALEVDGNTLHYHLNELVDVGLVENRKRAEPDRDGLYSYYRATAIGGALLEHGVAELMEREELFREAYSSGE